MYCCSSSNKTRSARFELVFSIDTLQCSVLKIEWVSQTIYPFSIPNWNKYSCIHLAVKKYVRHVWKIKHPKINANRTSTSAFLMQQISINMTKIDDITMLSNGIRFRLYLWIASMSTTRIRLIAWLIYHQCHVTSDPIVIDNIATSSVNIPSTFQIKTTKQHRILVYLSSA